MDALKKQTFATVTALPGSTRDEPSVIMTTPHVDREGDRVLTDGIDLAAFVDNPPLLWAHSSDEVPIGTVTTITRAPNGLRATWRWLQNDPLADRVRNAWQQGVVRAASIGFMSLDRKRNEYGGFDHVRTNLLELSLVPVPANPHAVRQLKSLQLWDGAEATCAACESPRAQRRRAAIELEDDAETADAIEVEADDVRAAMRDAFSGLVRGVARRTEPYEPVTALSREELRRMLAEAVAQEARRAVPAAVALGLRRARGRVD